jgi:RimJ/RimL family protein N-acetyltransferase
VTGQDAVLLRRAEVDDVDFLVELDGHEEVEPFLAAVRASEADAILAEVERSRDEPDAFGLFVIEVGGARAGTVQFERTNRRSRIAHVSGLAVHPDARGRGVGGEAVRQLQQHLIFALDFHRLELEVYGFNERALAQLEAAGFVREGVKRSAYWRHGAWVDGILFGLVREDLEGVEREGADP